MEPDPPKRIDSTDLAPLKRESVRERPPEEDSSLQLIKRTVGWTALATIGLVVISAVLMFILLLWSIGR